jgi:hypothetical protein
MSNGDTVGIGFGSNGIELRPSGLRIKEKDFAPLVESLSKALANVVTYDGLKVALVVSEPLGRRAAFDALATLVHSVSPDNPAYDLVWESV